MQAAAAYGLPGDLGWEMPEPGREPGAITTLRLQGSEGKKKNTEPNPRSQHPAAPEPNPHGNCKNPHPTLPVWAACFGRGGKKKG